MSGQTLIFRELRESDFDLLYGMFSNDDVMRYTVFETCKGESELQSILDELLGHKQTGLLESHVYAVFERNRFIGLGILEISCRNACGGCGEMGYLLMPEFWGKGYATRIAQKLLALGFEEMGLHRICALCNELNTASEKVMKKLGMVKEGELRKKRFKFGRWHNELCYAVLDDEWRKNRKQYQKRNGQQLRGRRQFEMSSLNRLVAEYTQQLRQGRLQAAYKGVLEYLSMLRGEFAKRFPDYEIGSSIYQGYMDMSYFSLNTKAIKAKGLKVALVYLHEKGAFEIWLSARNREIIKTYQAVFTDRLPGEMDCFHDSDNEDAVLEHTLTAAPDFDHQAALTDSICAGTERFISVVTSLTEHEKPGFQPMP